MVFPSRPVKPVVLLKKACQCLPGPGPAHLVETALELHPGPLHLHPRERKATRWKISCVNLVPRNFGSRNLQGYVRKGQRRLLFQNLARCQYPTRTGTRKSEHDPAACLVSGAIQAPIAETVTLRSPVDTRVTPRYPWEAATLLREQSRSAKSWTARHLNEAQTKLARTISVMNRIGESSAIAPQSPN